MFKETPRKRRLTQKQCLDELERNESMENSSSATQPGPPEDVDIR